MNMNDYRNAMSRLTPDEACKERILDMARNTQKHSNHPKRAITRKTIMISVIAAVFSCGSIAAAAALGGFNRNRDVWQQEREHEAENGTVSYSYEKLDHNNYDMLNAAADAPHAAGASDEVQLTVESTYFDGMNLVCSVRAETDAMPDAMVLDTAVQFTIGGVTYTDTIFEDGQTAINLMLLRDEAEQNVYYGMLDFRLAEPVTVPEEVQMTYTGFRGYTCGVYTDENFTGKLGSVEVSVPVTPQTELCKTIAVDYEGSALKVQSVEYSPAGIGITYQYPGAVIVLYDADGNKIPRNENHILTEGDWVTEFFEAADTSAVTIRMVNKNSKDLDVLDEVTVPVD